MVLELQGNSLFIIITINNNYRYGITPRTTGNQKPQIEVFNPNQSSDEEKTPTKILFDNDGNFLEFGAEAERKYAELVDEGETAYMFQTVSIIYF